MSEAEAPVVVGDASAALEALRQQGADKADPVRFHFLETLARRLETQQGPTRQVLEAKLAQGLDEYRQRIEARRERARSQTSHATQPSPLKELVTLLQQQALPETAVTPVPAMADHAPQTELKSVSYFRETWSRLATDQRVNQALEQEPENAGPLNSHLLILRALKLMRDTAPDYLNRFLSYADTLLWLDGASTVPPPSKVGAPSEDAKSKKKSSRGKETR